MTPSRPTSERLPRPDQKSAWPKPMTPEAARALRSVETCRILASYTDDRGRFMPHKGP